MSTKSINLEVILNCSPQTAFDAWLDSKTHGQMVDANAQIEPNVGGKFNIWDGELIGETVEIDDKNLKIVQTWRSDSDDWEENYYTNLTLNFLPYQNHTKLVLSQIDIPTESAEDIKQGWKDFYFKPMQKFFSSNSDDKK